MICGSATEKTRTSDFRRRKSAGLRGRCMRQPRGARVARRLKSEVTDRGSGTLAASALARHCEATGVSLPRVWRAAADETSGTCGTNGTVGNARGLSPASLLAVSCDGEFYVPIYGGNGNIMGYVDESGAFAAKFEYDPYGDVISIEGGPFAPMPSPDGSPVPIPVGLRGEDFSFGFSTKYHDREVGLIAYQLRSYSPTLGRWLNRDPIEEEGGVNLYVFCGNLTIDKHLGSSLDYLGLSCCPGEIRIISIVYADASSISRGNPDFKNLRELLRNLELLNYIQLGISGVSSVLDGLIAGVEKGVTSAAASGADFIVGKAVSLDGGVGVSAIEQMYTRYKVNFPQLRGWLYYQQCEKHMLIFTRWVDKSISSTEAVAIDLHGMDGSNPIKTFEAAEAEIKAELLTKFKKVLGGGR